jgi:hypothetical protein
MSDLQQEMEEYFAEYTRRWNKVNDYASLIEMWDQDDDRPFYRGMEKPGFFETWERLKLYWDPDHCHKLVTALQYNFINVRAKLVTSDVAVAYFDAEWDMKALMGPAISGTDPCIAVFKRTDDGWKMNSYVEACTHPAAYEDEFADKEDKCRPSFRKLLVDRCEANCRNCRIPCKGTG